MFAETPRPAHARKVRRIHVVRPIVHKTPIFHNVTDHVDRAMPRGLAIGRRRKLFGQIDHFEPFDENISDAHGRTLYHEYEDQDKSATEIRNSGFSGFGIVPDETTIAAGHSYTFEFSSLLKTKSGIQNTFPQIAPYATNMTVSTSGMTGITIQLVPIDNMPLSAWRNLFAEYFGLTDLKDVYVGAPITSPTAFGPTAGQVFVKSIEELPAQAGKVIGEVAGGVGKAAGSVVGGVFSGLGAPLTIGLLALGAGFLYFGTPLGSMIRGRR